MLSPRSRKEIHHDRVVYTPSDYVALPSDSVWSRLGTRIKQGIDYGTRPTNFEASPHYSRAYIINSLGRSPVPDEFYREANHGQIPAKGTEKEKALRIEWEKYIRGIPSEYGKAGLTQYGGLEELGFQGGQLLADLGGMGSRALTIFNLHPQDVTHTLAKAKTKELRASPFGGTNLPRDTQAEMLAGLTASAALGILSGDYNPLNLAEGGRVEGYQAVNPAEDDPRQSTSPLLDLIFHRQILGNTGKLLPWEQFHEERPDVTREEYQAYKDYLWNKSSEGDILHEAAEGLGIDNPDISLNNATFGLVRSNLSGIDGPEARVLGYRVTVPGVLGAAAATYLMTRALSNRLVSDLDIASGQAKAQMGRLKRFIS